MTRTSVLTLFLFSALATQGQAADNPVAFGFDVAYGYQVRAGSGQDTGKVQLGLFHAQVIAKVAEKGRFRFEMVPEWQLAQSIPTRLSPSSRFIVGLNWLIRFNFRTSKRWTVFFEPGAGAASVGLRVHELDGYLQYTLQAGIGAKYRTGKHISLVLESRWSHFSNNNTILPNHGVNLVVIAAGINIRR